MNKDNAAKKDKFRFAPSPTGGVHIGTARTAVFNFLAARSMGAGLILRIEDTDIKRSRADFEESIIRDLRWLGVQWDEFTRQSERFALYRQEAERLLAGSRAYRCFCSPERIEQVNKKLLSEGRMPGYDGRCLALSQDQIEEKTAAGIPHTIRFAIPERTVEFDDLIRGRIRFASSVLSDFVLIKSDGSPSYNFAVVVDDHDMGISHVLRGEDHITNTARQILLYESLGYAVPRFAHLSMILATDGSRLSKRHGATTIGEFREAGYLPEALANYLCLLSWAPREGKEKFTLQEAIREFDIHDISKNPATFDIDKLNWLNGQYIREKSPEELAGLLTPYLVTEKIVDQKDLGRKRPKRRIFHVAEAFGEKIKVLSEIGPIVRPLFDDTIERYEEGTETMAGLKSSKKVVSLFLGKLKDMLQERKEQGSDDEISVAEAEDLLREMAAALKDEGIKGRFLYMPLRVYLFGNMHGPELPKLISVLGIENCIHRVLGSCRHFQDKGV